MQPIQGVHDDPADFQCEAKKTLNDNSTWKNSHRINFYVQHWKSRSAITYSLLQFFKFSIDAVIISL